MPQLSEVMSRDVITVTTDTSLAEAMRLMKEHDVSALPVCADSNLIGMLSEVDITSEEMAAAINAASGDLNQLRVRDAMTGGAYFGSPDQDVDSAVRFMERHGIHHLPILESDRRLSGIVSLRAIKGS